MISRRRVALFAAVVWLSPLASANAHEMAMPAPMMQPGSPVHLKSCYFGTNFMFGDPKLKTEETKMQLGAALDEPVPAQYRMLGLRFQFGSHAGKRSSDVVVFTGTEEASHNIMASPPGLEPSGYLPRVSDYEHFECGVDFATALDWESTWFDIASDVIACETPKPVPKAPAVWLTALELQPAGSDAVFLMADEKQTGVSWSLDGSAPAFARFDQFGRAVVSLGRLRDSKHVLTFGAAPAQLDQQVCFRGFAPSR